MRLTNNIRNAFIRAAMQDVPVVDYNEQARKLSTDHMNKLFATLFPGIDKNAAEESKWLRRTGYWMPGDLNSVYLYGPEEYKLFQRDSKLCQKLEEINRLHWAQKNMQKELQEKLRATAYSCTTRKQLCELLPEFEKYLPADDSAAIRTLPSVTNLVSDFVKAGWPKSKNASAK